LLSAPLMLRLHREFFADTVAEYQWARDAAGLASSTPDGLVQPVVELSEYFDLVPWELTPRHLDRYFAGPAGQARGFDVTQQDYQD
jgi:integrase/recombinase XerC